MLHFYKGSLTVMWCLLILVGANVHDLVRTDREYQINRKVFNIISSNDWTRNCTGNEYGEFKNVIHANLLQITAPVNKFPLTRKLWKRETDIKVVTPIQMSGDLGNCTKTGDGLRRKECAEVGHSKQVKQDNVKKRKKKKKHALDVVFKHFWHKMRKWMPNFKNMHGPTMFMLGMAQANFNNFVMHALMMSKMALGSVIMMIIREFVFGDKDQPVKYYNFGYEHPHSDYHYDYSRQHESPVSDDYRFDYRHRRKRQTYKYLRKFSESKYKGRKEIQHNKLSDIKKLFIKGKQSAQ